MYVVKVFFKVGREINSQAKYRYTKKYFVLRYFPSLQIAAVQTSAELHIGIKRHWKLNCLNIEWLITPAYSWTGHPAPTMRRQFEQYSKKAGSPAVHHLYQVSITPSPSTFPVSPFNTKTAGWQYIRRKIIQTPVIHRDGLWAKSEAGSFVFLWWRIYIFKEFCFFF